MKLAWLAIATLAALALTAGLAQSMSLSGVNAALLALPVAYEDRSHQEAKRVQYAALSAAISREAKTRDEAAFLVAWGWHESAFSIRIQEGRCDVRKRECDVGKDGVPRARGVWQLHRNGLSQEHWDRLIGIENSRYQAEEAARRARGALGMCRTVEGAFRSLTGRGCDGALPGVGKRVETFRAVRRRL